MNRVLVPEGTESVTRKQRQNLARRLRKLRNDKGLTRQELATSAGLSMGAVAAIEQGRAPDPRISTILALAEALDTKVEDLFAD